MSGYISLPIIISEIPAFVNCHDLWNTSLDEVYRIYAHRQWLIWPKTMHLETDICSSAVPNPCIHWPLFWKSWVSGNIFMVWLVC